MGYFSPALTDTQVGELVNANLAISNTDYFSSTTAKALFDDEDNLNPHFLCCLVVKSYAGLIRKCVVAYIQILKIRNLEILILFVINRIFNLTFCRSKISHATQNHSQ